MQTKSDAATADAERVRDAATAEAQRAYDAATAELAARRELSRRQSLEREAARVRARELRRNCPHSSTRMRWNRDEGDYLRMCTRCGEAVSSACEEIAHEMAFDD